MENIKLNSNHSFKKAWAIQTPKGDIIISSLNSFKKQCIENFFTENDFNYWRKKGFECVKVNVQIKIL